MATLNWTSKRSLFFHSYSYQLRFSIGRKKISFSFLHHWFLFLRLIRKISTDHITLEPSNGFSPLVGSNSRAFVCDKAWQCSLADCFLLLPLSSPHEWILSRIILTFYSFSSGWMLISCTGSHCRLIKNLSRRHSFCICYDKRFSCCEQLKLSGKYE